MTDRTTLSIRCTLLFLALSPRYGHLFLTSSNFIFPPYLHVRSLAPQVLATPSKFVDKQPRVQKWLQSMRPAKPTDNSGSVTYPSLALTPVSTRLTHFPKPSSTFPP